MCGEPEEVIKIYFIRDSVWVAAIVEKMGDRRFGHVKRIAGSEALRITMKINVEWKRGRRKPKKRWIGKIEYENSWCE